MLYTPSPSVTTDASVVVSPYQPTASTTTLALAMGTLPAPLTVPTSPRVVPGGAGGGNGAVSVVEDAGTEVGAAGDNGELPHANRNTMLPRQPHSRFISGVPMSMPSLRVSWRSGAGTR